MMTPRSPSSGSLRDMCDAWSRLRLNVAIRLSSTTRRNSASGCGPSLPSVRVAVPPPAVFTAMWIPPSALGRVVQRLLDVLLVGDVDGVERAAERSRDLGAGRGRKVEDRDRRALRAAGAPPTTRAIPDAPPTTTAFLPLISISVFPLSAR